MSASANANVSTTPMVYIDESCKYIYICMYVCNVCMCERFLPHLHSTQNSQDNASDVAATRLTTMNQIIN